jgi:predicted alpha/beta hydrolase
MLNAGAPGVKSVGHFGFFRERFRDSLWRETADWLESR